jgi:hypothetical protein
MEIIGGTKVNSGLGSSFQLKLGCCNVAVLVFKNVDVCSQLKLKTWPSALLANIFWTLNDFQGQMHYPTGAIFKACPQKVLTPLI